MIKTFKPPKKFKRVKTPCRNRVLVLCKDDQIGLWMVRSLGMNGLTAYSICSTPDGLAAHSRYSSGVWYGNVNQPSPADVDSIFELARELGVGSIMPLSEPCHLELINRRDEIEPEIHLFSPPGDAFSKATDKDYLHRLCPELGISVAKGTTLDKLMEEGGESLSFPLVLRTRKQTGEKVQAKAPWGRVAYAADINILSKLHDRVKSYANNIIVQEFHPGVTDQVQVVMKGSQVFLCEFLAETHLPLAGGVSVRRITFQREDLIKDAVKLLKTIGWEGAAGVQFHYDKNKDNYIFMEINPRFVGGLPTMVRAGFHGPFLLWQSHFEPTKMQQRKYVNKLRSQSLRFATYWLHSVLKGEIMPPGERRPSRFEAIVTFLWHLGPWTKDDSFLFNDPKPYWADMKKILKFGRRRR